MSKSKGNVVYADKLAEIIRPGDIVFTVGAGDIFRAGEALLKLPRE